MEIDTSQRSQRLTVFGLLVVGLLAVSGRAQAGEPFSEICLDSGDFFSDVCPWEYDSLSERSTLFGDMGGLRPSLAEHGIALNLSTTQFYQGITSGGREEAFQYGGRNDYLAKIDGAKLGIGQGLMIDLHGETRYGEATNGIAGSISVPNAAMLFPLPGQTTTQLTNVTVTQFLSEQFAVFGGKINTLDAYANPFAAGRGTSQFMNLSLVFPPILARTVPYSALGAGLIVLHDRQPVFSFMVLDSGGEPNRSGFEDPFAEGVSLVSLVSIPVTLAGRPGHQQLEGAWSNHSVSSLDQSGYLGPLGLPGLLLGLPGNPLAAKDSSWALHYSFDQYLFVDPCNPQRGWGVFGQASISDGNPNPIRWFFSTGIGGSSPLRSRPADTMGIGYYYFQLSSDLKNTLAPLLPLANEQGVEIYYNMALSKWCHISPNLQVIEPARQRLDTTVLVGVRTHIDF